MIIDLVPAFNEIDLFAVRYNELKHAVDKFVICEAQYTHSGSIKPLYFSDWYNSRPDGIDLNMIEIIVFDNGSTFCPLTKEYSWVRENYQRELLGHWVKENCAPTDICMLSDLDEIPRAKAVESILDDPSFHGIWYFEQVLSYLFMNTTQGTWGGTKIFYADTADMSIDRFMTNHIRYRDQFDGVIKNGGWHMSSCGGLDKINTKMISFGHTECSHFADGRIEESMRALVDPFNRNPLTIVSTDTLPQYVIDNLDYFIARGYIYREP